MTVLYAIGDIHGDLDQLLLLHDRINADIKKFRVEDHLTIHIGDLVDRRFKSKEVVDYLIEGHKNENPWITLKGNHDRMMTLFIDYKEQDPILRKDLTWLHPRLGGLTTLESYGITGYDHEQEEEIQAEAIAKVPSSHLTFLRNLPTHFDAPQAFFAHAGVNPEKTLEEQTEDDLIWVRAPFHNHPNAYEKLIVHGHTPVGAVTRYANNRINIDTGAAYGGPLSAIVLDGRGIWQLSASGREEIPFEK